jgi:two-component system, LuxR family, response regulator FixJ
MATVNRVVHVIDGDIAARDALTFLLGTAQFTVRAYESALIFLDGPLTLDPGCVITDMRMPGMNGIALLRRLKAHKIDWPVILITGHADLSLAIEAMRKGAVDFFEKPYDDSSLIGAVEAVLNSASRLARKSKRRRRFLRECPHCPASSSEFLKD